MHLNAKNKSSLCFKKHVASQLVSVQKDMDEGLINKNTLLSPTPEHYYYLVLRVESEFFFCILLMYLRKVNCVISELICIAIIYCILMRDKLFF